MLKVPVACAVTGGVQPELEQLLIPLTNHWPLIGLWAG